MDESDTSGRSALGRVSYTRDTTFTPLYYKSQHFIPGDVNGDGKTDLVWTFWHNNELARVVYLANANGAGFDKLSLEREQGLFNHNSIKDLASHLGDVNGDNRADLVVTYRDGSNLVKRLYLATAGGTDFNLAGNAHVSSPSGINDALFMSSAVHLADINSDGRADLLYTYTYGNTFGWISYLANLQGNGFVAGQSGTLAEASTTVRHQQYLLADTSADAKPDIVWAAVDGSNALRRTTLLLPQTYPDHIERITDGFGNQTNITYQYLADSTAGQIYVRGTGASYPVRDDNGISYVVSRVTQSDGVGGLRAFDYRYEAARTDLRGRGFLGFQKRQVTDAVTQLVTTETYLQNYPQTGLAQSVVVMDQNGVSFEKTFNHWRSQLYGTGASQRHFGYLADTVSIKYNPGTNTPLFVGLTLNSFDFNHGNLTQEIKRVGSGFTGLIDAAFDPAGTYIATQVSGWEKQQTNNYTYDNNTANWRLGFITSQTLTVEKPGETTRSVVNRFTPRSVSSFLKASEIVFDGTTFSKTIQYPQRDGWGNATRIETVGRDYTGTSLPVRVNQFGTFADGLYPEWERNARNHLTSYQYNTRIGLISRSVDPNSQTVDTLYDDFGRKVYEKLADGTDIISTYSYTVTGCPAGAVYTVLTRTLRGSAQGSPDTQECFDTFDRVVQHRTQDFSGALVYRTTAYDSLGRVYRTSIPRTGSETAQYTTFTYDPINRVIREDKPGGGYVVSQFAPGGTGVITQTVTDNIVDTVNGNRSTVSVKHFNAQNQVIRALDHGNTPTDFAYDVWDNLRWIRVNNDPSTDINISFNDAGFKTRLADPSAGVIEYQYDSFANVRLETSNPGSGQEIITSDYDALDRLIMRRDTVAGVTTLSGEWEYDTRPAGVGLAALTRGPNFLEEYFYDARSRVKEKKVTLYGTTPRSFHYRYDNFSRVELIAYPGGLRLQNGYNATGYHNRVTNLLDNVVVWQANSGDKWGNVTQFTLGNGLVAQRLYHQATGLIQTARTGTTATNGSIQNNTYLFDTSNNLVQRTYAAGTAQTERFTYDGLNRVRTATTTGLSAGTRTLQYNYDALGNITFKTNVSDVDGYRYDRTGNAGPHAVTRTILAGATRNHTYDTKGNMVSSGTRTLRHTIFNNPYSITDSATNSTVDFEYGPDRRRFYQRKVQSGSVTETLYYDRGAYEIVKQGSTLRQKVYIGDYAIYQTLLVGTDIKRPAAILDSKYTYLHRDNLGSTDAVTNQAGALVTRNLFDPFGLRRDSNGQNATPAYLASLPASTFDTTTRGYTGHEQLDSVGLIHMNGRVYDPTLGRFLSPDQYVQYPHFSQSYNRYSYVLNNPLSYNDPGGELIPVLVWGAVAAWRAYSAYDTVTSAIDNYNTVVDPNASTVEKSMAVLDTGSSVVLPKAVRDIAKKTVGPSMDAAVSKIGDLAEKATDRIKVSAGPLPSKNQVDSNSLSRTGEARKVDASGRSDVTQKKESGSGQGDSSASGEAVGESAVAKAADGTDFVVGSEGMAVATSQSRMRQGFDDAGFPSQNVVSPTSGNIVGQAHTLPDGNIVRTMAADGRNPKRASFTNGNGGAIDLFTGKPPQPPSGLTRAERKQFVRERSHIVQGE